MELVTAYCCRSVSLNVCGYHRTPWYNSLQVGPSIVKCFNLAGWRPLLKCPQPQYQCILRVGHGFKLAPKKSISIISLPNALQATAVNFFNLTTKTWGSMATKFITILQIEIQDAGIDGRWPYPKNQLIDSTQRIVRRNFFFTTMGKTYIGCNWLPVVLEFKTKEWRSRVAQWWRLKPQLGGPGRQCSKQMIAWMPSTPASYVLEFGYRIREMDKRQDVGNTPCPRSEAVSTQIFSALSVF